MADTPRTILVKVTLEEVVPIVIVAGIANAFAEWLERNELAPKSTSTLGDHRSYEELARDFAEEWASHGQG